MRSAVAAALACVLLGATPAPMTTPSPGDAAFAAGNFDAAQTAYAAAHDAAPDDADALLGLATLALYRNELALAQRDVDAAAASGSQDPRIARLRSTIAGRERDADGSSISPFRSPVVVPFEVTDPLPLLHAVVNGRDGLFFIDTGGANLTLDPDFAKAAGVGLTPAGNGVFAGGKLAPVLRGEAATVALGAVLMHDVAVDGIPTHGLPFFLPRRADGVIGTRLLAHFIATIDYVHGDLVLRARGDSAAVEEDAAATDALVVPMLLVGDHFIFARGRINDGPNGWMLVDTGLAGGGLSPSKAALADSQIALDTAHAGTGVGAGGPVQVVPFTAAVTLGTRRLERVAGLATPGGDPYGIFPFAMRGAVSHGYFRNVALTFDFPAMRLLMQP